MKRSKKSRPLGPTKRQAPGRPSFLNQLMDPVDNGSVCFFRVAFGLLMLALIVRYFVYDLIDLYWIEPEFHFTYYGFEWVKPWPGDGMYYHLLGLGILSIFVAVGFCYRFSVALFCLGFTLLFLLEEALYQNHLYLICLISFWMIFIPAHGTFSVDSYRRPAIRSDTAPAWGLWLLRAQMGIVYFYGGVAKLNPDWLRGEPMRRLLRERTDYALIGPLLSLDWMPYFFSYFGLLLDLLAFPLLLWRKTRPYAFVVTLIFHLSNAFMWRFIDVFPWFAICLTALFFSPDWPRRLLRRWGSVSKKRRSRVPQPITLSWARLAPRQRALVVVLAVHFAIQLLVPLRHLLYPGRVDWTDEGFRFAWRMMLRIKQGEMWFRVEDPKSQRMWTVDPQESASPEDARKMAQDPVMIREFTDYLRGVWSQEMGNTAVEIHPDTGFIRFFVTDPATDTTWPVDLKEHLVAGQAPVMLAHTDMILQFSHHLAKKWVEEKGYESVKVRAEAWVSLNGHKHQLVVDPSVDLAAQPRSLRPSLWIRPFQQP